MRAIWKGWSGLIIWLVELIERKDVDNEGILTAATTRSVCFCAAAIPKKATICRDTVARKRIGRIDAAIGVGARSAC